MYVYGGAKNKNKTEPNAGHMVWFVSVTVDTENDLGPVNVFI